jgi:HAMP domain-containing protein
MLRNAPIRTKLVVALLGPLLVLAVVGLVGIRQNQAESDRAARSTAFARLAAGLAPLIHELQAERSLSTSYIDSRRRQWGGRLAEQRRRLDGVAATYRANAQRLGADDRLLAEKIAYGLAELGRLGEQRKAIDTAPIKAADLAVEAGIELHEEEGEEDLENAVEHGHGPIDTPGKALEQYTDTISDLLDINTEIAPGSNDEALLKGVAASVALARAKDFADSQRSLMQRVFAAKRFQGAEQPRLSALVAAETVYRAQFEANATEAQHAFFEDMVSGEEVETVEESLDAALATSVKQPKLGVDPQAWFDDMTVKLDRMRTVEQRLSGDVIATSSALQRGADRRAFAYSLLLAAGVVMALVLALITARSLIRPVRRLEAAAEETAERRLPGVVQRLQDGEQVDLQAESAPPIEVRSRDEIGRLAEAFNAVHRVAVRVAGREAALRRSIADMFLNLARRSQSLIERQLEVIDELEASGSEAEVRSRLAELDHLATRMRRNAENLIILSGSEPARRWRGPIGLVDVVRAAVEEVKEHTRVELLPIDQVQLVGNCWPS